MLAIDIVKDVISDVTTFFLEGTCKIYIVYNYPSAREHAFIKGTGDNATIYLSTDLCDYDADTLDKITFIILIITHELAHLFNRHNKYFDNNQFESKSIEAYADYFSSKLALCVITYGELTKKHFTSDINILLTSFSLAIRNLNESVYVNHDKYPNKLTRTMSVCAGFTSFFDAFTNKLDVARSIRYLSALYENSIELIQNENSSEVNLELTNKMSQIHKQIQDIKLEIISNIHPEIQIYLQSNFNRPDNEKYSEINNKIQIAKSQGHTIPRLS